mmetsp:Transcript_10947/g.23462  ORF Transcript_10947/g.23462 Transcript_10947/m.23462 type:complete len:82 (+) Transcript_10947:59-304(+)
MPADGHGCGCFGRIFGRRSTDEESRPISVDQAAGYIDEQVKRISMSMERPEKAQHSFCTERRERRSEEFGGDLHLMSMDSP